MDAIFVLVERYQSRFHIIISLKIKNGSQIAGLYFADVNTYILF